MLKPSARSIARSRTVSLLCAAPLVAAALTGCVSPERAAKMEAAAAANSQFTGRPAPDFTLPNQDGIPVRLADQHGQWTVIYFYPADGTPGCTCQAEEFTRVHGEFQKLRANVFGISPDTVESHRQVHTTFRLTFDLLADPEKRVMSAYGAWVKTPFGARTVRSTVLINPDGIVAYHWPEVIPEGHAERVRAKLAEIKSAS